MTIRTVLGIDYGKKRVGIAIGNTLTRHAEPLDIIEGKNDAQLIDFIVKLATQWQASALALGIPCHPDGTPHEMTAACESFAQQLLAHTSLPIHRVDERYSSATLPQAVRKNARGQMRAIAQDDLAAAVILQQFLNECVD